MMKLLPVVLAIVALSGPCPRPPAPQAQAANSIPPEQPLLLVTQHVPGADVPPSKAFKRRDVLALLDPARQRFASGEISAGARLRFELFDGIWLTAIVRYVESTKEGGLSLIAEGQDRPAHVTLTYDQAALTVFIDLPDDGDVLIVRFADDKSRLLSNQYAEQVALTCPARSERVLPAPDAVAFGAELDRSRPSQIDVGVMYTRNALCTLPSGNGCDDEAYLRQLLKNWAFKASSHMSCSGINGRVNLVNVAEIGHRETGTLAGDLAAFKVTTVGSGAALKKFRIDNKADVVLVLVSAAQDAYGLAEVFDTATGPQFVDRATGVLVASLAFGGHLLLHELGHTMGGGHQYKHVGRYDYSRANEIKTDQGTYYTLMGESPPAFRLKLFAGPKVKLGNGYTGSSSRDNVRTLNETRAMVEAFQPGALLGLGPVQCGAAFYGLSVPETTNP